MNTQNHPKSTITVNEINYKADQVYARIYSDYLTRVHIKSGLYTPEYTAEDQGNAHKAALNARNAYISAHINNWHHVPTYGLLQGFASNYHAFRLNTIGARS